MATAQYRLVRDGTGEHVKTGDVLHDFRGDRCTVASWNGRRVLLKYGKCDAVEYFPSVISCRIERVTEGSPATVAELPPSLAREIASPAPEPEGGMIASRSRLLAAKFIERATSLGYKGVKRDNAALDFWCGAAAAADACGDADFARALGAQAALIIAVRGWMGVQHIAGNLPR